MTQDTITITSKLLAAFEIEERSYAICALSSEYWKRSRVQVFSLHDPLFHEGEFNPLMGDTVTLSIRDLEKIVENGEIENLKSLPNSWAWPFLVSARPDLFPQQGTLIGISDTLPKAIEQVRSFTTKRLLSSMTGRYMQDPPKNLTELTEFLEDPQIQLYVDVLKFANPLDAEVFETIQEEGVTWSNRLGIVPSSVKVQVEPLVGKRFLCHNELTFKFEDGLLVLKGAIIANLPPKENLEKGDSYRLNYLVKPGVISKPRDVLEGRIPCTVERIFSPVMIK